MYPYQTRSSDDTELKHQIKEMQIQINHMLSILRKGEVKASKRETTYLTIEDVVKRFKVSKKTIQNWRKNGRLAFIRIGRRVFFREEDIEAMMKDYRIEQLRVR